MSAVFLDTVGLVALLNKSDQWRPAALTAQDKLVERGAKLVSTTLVFLEAGNALSRTSLRRNVGLLLRQFEQSGLVFTPTDSELAAAWRAYEAAPPGGPGVVDCVSFEVMRRLGLSEAFTNDRHFADAGFRPLF